MKVNVHLNFNGQCEEAFRFYEECLGAKITFMLNHGDSPMAGQVPVEWHSKIMHATLTVDGTELTGADSPPGVYEKPGGFCVSLGVFDEGDAERIFQALAEKGKVQMALQPTFWTRRFGMVVDRFGIPWMINCENSG